MPWPSSVCHYSLFTVPKNNEQGWRGHTNSSGADRKGLTPFCGDLLDGTPIGNCVLTLVLHLHFTGRLCLCNILKHPNCTLKIMTWRRWPNAALKASKVSYSISILMTETHWIADGHTSSTSVLCLFVCFGLWPLLLGITPTGAWDIMGFWR